MNESRLRVASAEVFFMVILLESLGVVTESDSAWMSSIHWSLIMSTGVVGIVGSWFEYGRF
ncbi:MAG: hypothetical protein EBS53_15300 [Bacteroidetes bacterium]|nr:hypothetical protein [Bacteroidota bacterium]